MVLARVLFCVQNPKSTVVMQCAMFSKILGRPSDFFHSGQRSSRNRGRGDIHTNSPSKVLLQKTQKGAIYKLCHVQKKFICYLYEYIYIYFKIYLCQRCNCLSSSLAILSGWHLATKKGRKDDDCHQNNSVKEDLDKWNCFYSFTVTPHAIHNYTYDWLHQHNTI